VPLDGSVKRVAVVSALPAVRAGLRALVESGGAYEVAAEAPSRSQLPEAAQGADVLVLDAEPGAEAGDLAAADAAAFVILGTLDGEERLPVVLARPFALLPRDASGEQLRAALDAVANGLLVLDVKAAERLLPAHTADARPATDAETADHLTPREREVLQLVAEGLPNKTIARHLAISDHTVKFHLASLMTKLNAASRTEAVHQAARRGLISL
jgi:DNA-binding NarL/FixJ family response regulator